MVIQSTARQDVVGPMARTVRDAAYLLTAIAGKDPLDNYTMAQPFDTPPDYAQNLRSDTLRDARIGVPWNAIRPELYPPQSSEHMGIIMAAVNESLAILQSADPDRRSSTTKIRTFDDVIECTIWDPREQHPARDISQWDAAKASSVDPSSLATWTVYQKVYRQCGPDGIFHTLNGADGGGLDTLVLPSFLGFVLPAFAGSPVLTMPMGAFGPNTSTVWRQKDNPQLRSVMAGPGMPFGLSFIGARWSEVRLIGYSHAYEQRTLVREKVKPRIVPTAELQEFKYDGLIVQEKSALLPQDSSVTGQASHFPGCGQDAYLRLYG